MHYVDLQHTDGTCEPIYQGEDYHEADRLYRLAIDNATEDVANISWYHNIIGHQEHIGTKIFRALE